MAALPRPETQRASKPILRARHKVYLADAAIAPSVLLKGKAMLQDAAAVSRAVETAFFKHVFTRYYGFNVARPVSCWAQTRCR